MQEDVKTEDTLVYSYLAHRTAIGVLGIALPFMMIFGALIVFQIGLQSSISAYYYTGMRDVLVGTLWAIGFFLLAYKGYTRVDDIASSMACLFALGITLFPTTPELNPSSAAKMVGNIHLTFAALFFGTLIFFSLHLFTQTDPNQTPTKRKLQRNVVYQVCGYVMAACVLLIALYVFIPNADSSPIATLNPIFWLETIAIEAFGVSWLTKGEAILKDEVIA